MQCSGVDASLLLCFFPVSDEDIFGDFEDLETGEMHKAQDKSDSEGEGQASDDGEREEEEAKETGGEDKRLEKKKKQKAAFDAMYPLVSNIFSRLRYDCACAGFIPECGIAVNKNILIFINIKKICTIVSNVAHRYYQIFLLAPPYPTWEPVDRLRQCDKGVSF